MYAKTLRLLLLLILTLATGIRSSYSVDSMSESSDKNKNPTDSILHGLDISHFELYLGHIPYGSALQCALKDFLDIVRPEKYTSADNISTSNSGIRDYIQNVVARQPNFADQAYLFYSEVDRLTKNTEVKTHHFNKRENPTIDRTAGDSINPTLKPGWIWNLALKVAQGNSNLAIELIGACGNDDTFHGALQIELSKEQAQLRYRKFVEQIDHRLFQLRTAITQSDNFNSDCSSLETISSFDPSSISQHLETVGVGADDEWKIYLEKIGMCETPATLLKTLSMLREYRDRLTPDRFSKSLILCPRNYDSTSSFYLPRSLGSEVDISDNLKHRIINTQVPDDYDYHDSKSDKFIPPAKYYHVYGSALVACELIARGHSRLEVIELSRLSAWYYRVLTLTAESTKFNGEDFSAPIGDEETRSWLNSLEEILGFGRVKDNCNNIPELDEALELDRRLQTEQDAFELMRIRTVSGDLGKNLGILYTNIPMSTIASSMGGPFPYVRPPDWGRKRYERANRKFDSMMLDFDWTIKQHEIGARFALLHCKPDANLTRFSACQKSH